MLNSKSIGDKIAAARKGLHISQAQLAEQISISPQAVGKWERGESLPDIITLHRLAEILGVDLNYFSDQFLSVNYRTESADQQTTELPFAKPKKKFSWNWNMSSGNWADADFSGLKNLQERFSSSNLKNCKFRNSDLSGLILGNNNIEKCDFSHSDLRDSKIQSSNLLNNEFANCSFVDAVFSKNNVEKCNFSEANLSGAEFTGGCFERINVENAVWKFTTFKNSNLGNIVFDGVLEDCHFENCSFYSVKFHNATLLNTFFKHNRRFKKVEFINCKADQITLAFLSNNQANLTGISLIS